MNRCAVGLTAIEEVKIAQILILVSAFSVFSVVNSYALITARAIRLRRFERVRRAGALCRLGW